MKKLFIILVMICLSLPVSAKELFVVYTASNEIATIGKLQFTYFAGKVTQVRRTGIYYDQNGNWHTYKPMEVVYHSNGNIIKVGKLFFTYMGLYGRLSQVTDTETYCDEKGQLYKKEPMNVYYDSNGRIEYVGNIEFRYLFGKLHSIIIPNDKPEIIYSSS